MNGDPFRQLGLPADPALTDDDVRAAWRRVAAATHPDRADGGDPAAFAAAAAAYSDLRTAFGRGEALASPAAGSRRSAAHPARDPRPAAVGALAARQLRLRLLSAPARRISRGRPARLALRVAAGAAVAILIVAVNGWRPATPALLTGLAVWLVRAGRRDLAPAGRDRPGASR